MTITPDQAQTCTGTPKAYQSVLTFLAYARLRKKRSGRYPSRTGTPGWPACAYLLGLCQALDEEVGPVLIPYRHAGLTACAYLFGLCQS
jgi:hypothetical protein